MKRKTMIGLLTVLFSLLVTGARADTVKYLVLETTDKGKTEVALDKQPNISCSGGELKVTAGGEEILSTSMANVKDFYFESATTRIDETVGQYTVHDCSTVRWPPPDRAPRPYRV